MNRRKVRRYRANKRNSGVKFLGFIGIMIVAIICGYLTARFIVAPLLGYDTEVLKLDFPSKLTNSINFDKLAGNKEDSKKSEDTEQVSQGYALQYGVFSTESRADELVSRLEADGIETTIKEDGDNFKVIGPILNSKDDAVKALKDLKTDEVKDVFITSIK